MSIELTEKRIMEGLKDFQRATVERVSELLKGESARVLVADEVGLGKTMIARGVIAQLARYHKETLKDDLFKVVYVCSNHTIAEQNLHKLKINDNVKVEKSHDSRLSMQHLKIFQNKQDPELLESYIQLIPLTPTTSFNMTTGTGLYRERALIYAILQEYNPLKLYREELSILLQNHVGNWDWHTQDYKEKVEKCNEANNGEYLKVMFQKIDEYYETYPEQLEDLLQVCSHIREGIESKADRNRNINRLRKMMTEISVNLIDPDLVIMDEFQRFKELINTESDSETAVLAKKFFNIHQTDDQRVKILLLSATPYKLYSTLEEMHENSENSHYKEFMQVTDFLFENNEQQKKEFKTIWNDYSMSLSQLTTENFSVISAKKKLAEDALYKGITRTERNLVQGDGIIDVSNKDGNLKVAVEDINSYRMMSQLVQDCNLAEKIQPDYIKSAPYVMSYMEHYKIKERIQNYFVDHPQEIKKAKNDLLWLNRKSINQYKEIPIPNARMVNIMENALPEGAEKLIWIPPSLPYYEFGGCYKGFEHFSKTLVFSAWEMVPRSIATLMSYEAERRTVGKLISEIKPSKKKRKKKRSRKVSQENITYFSKQRFPSSRFTFKMQQHQPATMNLLAVLYPSVTLANLFDPIKTLNANWTLEEVKQDIGSKLKTLLESIPYIKSDANREDQSWYYMAPLLLDKHNETILAWLNENNPMGESAKDMEEDSALSKHFDRIREQFLSDDLPEMGTMPEDLLEVLMNMVLGSPAIAIYRTLGFESVQSLCQAVSIGKTLMDRFNSQEAISIVDLQYGSEGEDAYWKNVLKYCVDGNIQAMLDEYAHMLYEGMDLSSDKRGSANEAIREKLQASFKSHSASLTVDTYEDFKSRVMQLSKGEKAKRNKQMKLRTNYAVGFYDVKVADKSLQRKDNLRLAFNSPFRPFVLASTSIGQEGLDFHYYCRRIVHWNLPHNPIDLEQREGRINRYKSLAIRKNVATKYRDIHFTNDIWTELFNQANEMERTEGSCELIPFWCLSGEQPYKIERIVPGYPLSRDIAQYHRLIQILSLYRLSLGQARQEDLIEYLNANLPADQLKKLFMNLSPFYKQN